MLPIETERLVVRRLLEGDLGDFLEYEIRPEHTRYLARGPYVEERAQGFIAQMRDLEIGAEETYLHLALELKATGKMIGTVCVKVTSQAHRQGDIGWFLHGDYQRQGLATEASRALVTFAFADIGLHRITAHCDAANERSRRMMERLGMRREAHFRHAAFFDEEWHDQYLYAILEWEWKTETGENA